MAEPFMTITIVHPFVSGKADNADPTEVNPSNWNAQHTLTLAVDNLLGRASAGTGQVEEIPCTSVARVLLASASQLAMRASLGQMLTADIGLLQVTGAQIANGTITGTQLAGITAQSMTASSLGTNAPINCGLTASVSGGALTINLTDGAAGTPSATSPVDIVFRDATSSLTTVGTPVLRQVSSATSVAVPSGATFGVTLNGTPFRGWVVAIDNSGSVELGVVVCTALIAGACTISGAINNEGALIGATAISSGSATPGVIYATTGVSSKAFRIIGYFEYAAGLASAGVYSIAPTTLKLFGPGDKKPGDIVGKVGNYSGAVATGTTNLPNDDTIPQNTEGDQYMTQAITPTSTVNLLEVNHLGNYYVGGAGGSYLGVALFRDSGANAIAAEYSAITTTIAYQMMLGTMVQSSAPGVATTFNIRAGSTGGSTTTFNGALAARKFGGVMSSYLTVTEIMA